MDVDLFMSLLIGWLIRLRCDFDFVWCLRLLCGELVFGLVIMCCWLVCLSLVICLAVCYVLVKGVYI